MKKLHVVLFILVLFVVNFAFSQNNNFIGLNGGLSKATGNGGDCWNPGFNIGIALYPQVSKEVHFGIRIAYNRWSPNKKNILNEFNVKHRYQDFSASASSVEITPTIRVVAPLDQNEKSHIFWQVGAGWYIMNMKAEVTVPSYLFNNNTTFSIDKSDTFVGFNVGAGFMVNDSEYTKFVVFPMYHIIYTKDEPTKYFTINLGLLVKI